jgi:hypothetical protein
MSVLWCKRHKDFSGSKPTVCHSSPVESRGETMARSKAAKSLERVLRLTVDMEAPLRDAMDCATALRLIGHGLADNDGMEGRAITAIAWAACGRLDELKKLWDRTHKAARR